LYWLFYKSCTFILHRSNARFSICKEKWTWRCCIDLLVWILDYRRIYFAFPSNINKTCASNSSYLLMNRYYWCINTCTLQCTNWLFLIEIQVSSMCFINDYDFILSEFMRQLRVVYNSTIITRRCQVKSLNAWIRG
jgi:hypothetical protein